MKTATPDATAAPLAYSYIRFSTAEQSKGDSLRRQTDATRAWCEKNGARLDESTTLRDLGKSAFTGAHRQNEDRHALAAFLKLVEAGKIPMGSYLVIENLDRLSREDERAALRLWLDLLDAGINIVQLTPETIFRHEKSDMFDIMRAVMELSRGHNESVIKSERVIAAWDRKKLDARATGKILTHTLPLWVEERGGKLRLIASRVAVVKRIYKLSANGYGRALILKLFKEEKIAPFGGAQWSKQYIGSILKDRRAVGEHQPKRLGRPDGPPIVGYYPVAVSEEEWLAARAGAAQRKRRMGRVGNHINLFGGIIRNARDGDTYITGSYIEDRHLGKSGPIRKTLVNTGGTRGQTRGWSFPLEVFERAVLSRLSEIDPHEILNGDSGPDESLALAGELAGVEGKIAELEAELLNGDVAALARALRQLEGRKRVLGEQLAEARQKAASPMSEAWGEAKGLLAALDAAPDRTAARLKLRSILRRMVDEVWILVVPVPGKMSRLCAAQLCFAGGKKIKSYLIFHRPPRANSSGRQPAESRVWSLDEVNGADGLDLRRRADARELEGLLKAMPV